MTISALPHIQPQNLFTILNGSNAGKPAATAAGTLQDPTPQLSPVSSLMSGLEKLQQQDPARFQQVTANIASHLQQAATQASKQGDTTRANALNKLAGDFQTASQTGKMPSADQLQTDVSALKPRGHGHHHDPSGTDPLSSILTGVTGN